MSVKSRRFGRRFVGSICLQGGLISEENSHSRECTYSSLSSRLLFLRSLAEGTFSVLLCSSAIRSCSPSSYAASRLFIVDRRFPAVLSVLTRVVRVSLGLAFMSSIDGVEELVEGSRSLRGR